jgi:hypothetical protein
LNLKSLKTLKRVAKLFLEEKAIIKRVTERQEETGEEIEKYQIEIDRTKSSIYPREGQREEEQQP